MRKSPPWSFPKPCGVMSMWGVPGMGQTKSSAARREPRRAATSWQRPKLPTTRTFAL